MVDILHSYVCRSAAEVKGLTPYLDSLISKSLYWPNTLSTAQRTFGVLPSLLGSLPYGDYGFLHLKEAMPKHETIMTRLKENGYRSYYFYGGDRKFQEMDAFVKRNQFDVVLSDAFSDPKTPKSEYNDWGYHDDVLFRKSIEAISDSDWNAPRLDFYLTLSMHEPLNFNGYENYYKKIDRLIEQAQGRYKDILIAGKKYFAGLNYTDNAIRSLMKMYSNKPGYENTIFIITGDHSTDYIPQKSFLHKYHIPLIIYSPLLKKPEVFNAINSHWDIVPSLLAYLRDNYGIVNKDQSAFLGDGLDVSKEFRNIHDIPFMLNSRVVTEYLSKDLFVNDNKLYSLNSNMTLTPKNNADEANKLINRREAYKLLDHYVCLENKLLMDGTYKQKPDDVIREFYDYETSDVTVPYFKNISDEMFSSGKKSYHMSKSDQYGYITDNITVSSKTTSIEISLSSNVFVTDPGEGFPLIIFEVNDEEKKNVIYDQRDFNNANNSTVEKGRWNSVKYFSYFELPPDIKTDKVKIKLYIWNNKASDFFMDDLNVKITIK